MVSPYPGTTRNFAGDMRSAPGLGGMNMPLVDLEIPKFEVGWD